MFFDLWAALRFFSLALVCDFSLDMLPVKRY